MDIKLLQLFTISKSSVPNVIDLASKPDICHLLMALKCSAPNRRDTIADAVNPDRSGHRDLFGSHFRRIECHCRILRIGAGHFIAVALGIRDQLAFPCRFLLA